MKRTKDRAATWESEQALVDAFRAITKAAGLPTYPELEGWDLVVLLDDVTQVGVQAKLRGSVEVLAQAVHQPSVGPHIRAVLVPYATPSFRFLAKALAIGVLELSPDMRSDDYQLRERLGRMSRIVPRRTLWIPPYIPDLPAGVPSPRSVTPWKVKAVLLCQRLRAGETVTRAQLQAVGISPTFWTRPFYGPLEVVGREGKRAVYGWRHGVPLPDEKLPDVVEGLGIAPVPATRRVDLPRQRRGKA